MVALHDLLGQELLEQMLQEGFVRRQVHPSLPLAVLNYTEKAQFGHVWNPVTRQCRGLIYDTRDGHVVARPFPKFFNYGEWDFVDDSYRGSHCTVTDKLDGSLGILYPAGGVWGTWSIATRGSFTSPQAMHARNKLREHLTAGFQPDPHLTYLFEIIYPENRIVCDYGDMDDLVLLGVVNIEHGWTAGPFAEWTGPRAKVFSYATFEEALAAQPRKGAEGMVVHFAERDLRVKLKQADYVALHRIVTGLNERAVWQQLSSGKTSDEMCSMLPEEFHPWVFKVAGELEERWYYIYGEVEAAWHKIIGKLGMEFSRKDFAQLAIGSAYSAMLFNKLDNKDYGEAIWARIKPEHTQGPWSQKEETA